MPLLVGVGHERRVRALAVPAKPVGDLARVYRCVGTMKEQEQSSKPDRISADIMRPSGHLPQRDRLPDARLEHVVRSARRCEHER